MKFILRVREQHIGAKAITTLWLQEGRAGAACRMYGDMRPEAAEPVIELMQAAGVTIERAPVQQWDEASELPRGSVEEQVADTEQQGRMF
jgi:hypothetical protein